jgi:polysaccharide export outer membrane protein
VPDGTPGTLPEPTAGTGLTPDEASCSAGVHAPTRPVSRETRPDIGDKGAPATLPRAVSMRARIAAVRGGWYGKCRLLHCCRVGGGKMIWAKAAIGLCAGLALLTAACAAGSTSNVTYGALPLPDTTLVMDRPDLRVAPLDVVDIRVFGVEDFDGSYTVDPNGRIKFPLIGMIDAQGYTIFELASRIENGLREKYLRDPQVTASISDASGQQVTVEGSVVKPGMYPVRGRLTLLQAIAVSGGPTRGADPRRVVIFRTIEGKRMAAAFDLLRIRGGEVEDPVVYGNDVVVMDGSELQEGYDEFLRSIPLLGLFVMGGRY